MAGQRGQPKGSTKPSKIATLERRSQALALRRAGAQYDEIGKQLGISKVAAYMHVKKYLEDTAKTTGEDAEVVRAIELERLDRMLLGAWPKASNGDTDAIHTVLRIMERRAKLQGLDAPSKIAPTSPDGIEQFSGGMGLAAILRDGE